MSGQHPYNKNLWIPDKNRICHGISRIHHLRLTDRCQPVLKIIDEEIGKINKTLFYDVSVEEMKSLKQTMNKLQKRVEEGK